MSTLDIATLTAWIDAYRDAIAEHKDELTDLDRAIGDADHGSNMARGTQAAAEKLAEAPPATVADLGKAVGMTLVSTVGGASGPLYGTFFLRFGVGAGAVSELDGDGLAKAFRAGLDGVLARGKAELEDKTMVDALTPAVEALESGGDDLVATVSAAADAAEVGRDATVPLVARKGRASYLGDRSAGHMDPGAASTALLLRTLAQVLAA
ncbi:MAG: dihydroxyacetone kinase subunit DhaL [Galactobacter sp.]|uniref:dihydroxyacetone kinase subunit DhaL n=1 Tax=Galactobacter sp. TaxID=2676125 RepID=UPI0025C46CE1|nr:dihydroxyacetone kinase subunit DhaL [Galactobacter sp.]